MAVKTEKNKHEITRSSISVLVEGERGTGALEEEYGGR